jgi:hypothetical protein
MARDQLALSLPRTLLVDVFLYGSSYERAPRNIPAQFVSLFH